MQTKFKIPLVKPAYLVIPFALAFAPIPQSVHGQTGFPICSSGSSDADGDGWGWEDNASCIVDASTSTSSTNTSSGGTSSTGARASRFPACSSDQFDPDGDGFGWENNQTCVVSDETSGNTTGSAAPPPVAAALPGQRYPTCDSRQSDPDGDGFGFENNQTCLVTSATSNSNNNADRNPSVALPPPPVATVSPGTVNGRPVCLTDASDVNNSGFGYENNQTCAVLAGVTATRNDPLFNRRICEDWFEIPYGDFRLQNNVWNASGVFSDNWSQCITLSGNRSQPVASWDYNWLGRSEGNEFSVKSYPQVYYGRKTSFNQSGSVAETGLPAPLNSLPQFTIDFAFSETGNAERNVAFESFFHYSREAEDDNKQFELMVWVGKPEIRTPGPIVTTARIDGRDWDVHVNPALSWGYVAFVAQTPFSSGRLNWNAFIDWTRENGTAFGVPAIVNNTWMGAIELGTETFWGTGTFSLDRLNINRR